MDSFVIAISGGCNSGKTTFINKLREIAPNDVEVSDELIRTSGVENIDEIRKDQDKYFDLEKKIIVEKFRHDRDLRLLSSNKIVLLDRSLVDSMFYYKHYIDPEMLNAANKAEYPQFEEKIAQAISISLSKVYDKIVFFEPLPVTKTDPFRPKNIEEQKNIEAQEILSNLEKWTKPSELSRFESRFEFDGNIPRFISSMIKWNLDNTNYADYKAYEALFEQKLFLFNNIITNTYGSIEYEGQLTKEILWNSLLYSTDKQTTDNIISMIKGLAVEPDFMDSRCYPTGIFQIGGTMFVGEAPGQYGRSIRSEYLKPSFVYAKPSWILRQLLSHVFIYEDYRTAPYITNLLKYARKDNKVTHKDFDTCNDIFIEEVNAMLPGLIVALGNNVHTHIMDLQAKYPKVFSNSKIIKINHPASILYNGTPPTQYVSTNGGIIKNVLNSKSS